MSAGHQVPVEVGPAHDAALEQLLDNPKFQQAVAAYKNENDSYDIPFLGASNQKGDTVYFDRRFVEAIKAGKVQYGGQPFDPRPFMRVHEATEGALIRLFGLRYNQAHPFATRAEQNAIAYAGLDWSRYQAALKPFVQAAASEKPNLPPDLIQSDKSVARVSVLHPLLKQARQAKDGQFYVPDPARPGKYLMVTHPKLSHKSVQYGPGHPNGDHCAVCQHYQAPHCELVVDPIQPMGWCNKFEAGKWKSSTPTQQPSTATAQQKPIAGGYVKNPNENVRQIVFVRHGATKLNNADVSVDRIRGWKDVPLSPEGHEEAERVASQLKSNPPTAIVSSDLKRAHDTAHIISKHTGAPVAETSQGFRPWNVGKFAGQKSSAAVPVLAQYAKKHPEKKLPEGESFNDFTSRFFPALLEALHKHPGRIAVVAHHRNERLLKGWAKAGHPETGAVDIAEFDKKGDAPGHATEMTIPLDKLRRVVDHARS